MVRRMATSGEIECQQGLSLTGQSGSGSDTRGQAGSGSDIKPCSRPLSI